MRGSELLLMDQIWTRYGVGGKPRGNVLDEKHTPPRKFTEVFRTTYGHYSRQKYLAVLAAGNPNRIHEICLAAQEKKKL